MYVIVEFDGKQCALVPYLWLTEKKKKCFWPNVNLTEKMVESLTVPKPSWKTYNVVKVLFATESYKEGDERLKMYISGEVSSGNDNESLFPNETLKLKENYSNSEPVKRFNDTSPTNKSKRSRRNNVDGNQSRDASNETNKLTNNNETSTRHDALVAFDGDNAPSSSRDALNETNKLTDNIETSTHDVQVAFDGDNAPSSRSSTPSNSDSDSASAASPPRQTVTDETALVNQIRSAVNTILKEVLQEVFSTLSYMRKVQDQQSLILDELLRTVRNQGVSSVEAPPSGLPTFPIKSSNEFETMEGLLAQDHHMTYMIKRLSCVGGVAVRTATMNMLKYVLSNEVASGFNWSGHDKKPFKNTKINKAIFDAVKVAFRGREPADLTDKDIASAIKDWLKLAPQRLKYEHKKDGNN